ncbi:hypothetical protein [Nakamurella leprariae]|uniref:Uncharacterized protein n=1 Tax=Nakamurella leprariae TaxID=2803911 RepID=A0A938YEQ1_9ACTN|nr:hypothetical protein [Nakamurella leprariae]MBM9466814.1 hypothetical protein [Nakamurella leprariae]
MDGLGLIAISVSTVVGHWDAGTAIDPTGGAFRSDLVVVVVEVVAAVVLVVLALRRNRSDLVAPLVLAVVGVHCFPLAVVFGQPVLHLAAALVTAVSVVAVVVRSDAARGFWCGVLAAPTSGYDASATAEVRVSFSIETKYAPI